MLFQRMVLGVTAIALLCGSGCMFAKDVSVNEYETAKRIAAKITGLDTLANVRITTDPVTIAEPDDDTPWFLAKKLLINRPLWKVSYEVDALVHSNKVNPHIRGFDVYVDVSTGQVLKIVSRDDPNMPQQYRTGIRVSKKAIASFLNDDMYVIQDRLPLSTPTFKFADMIKMRGAIARHYECYYFLCQQHPMDGGQIIPAWLVILYGTEPIQASGGPNPKRNPRHYTLAEKYRRTFEIRMVGADSGKDVGVRMFAVGTNDDTFD